MPREVAEAIEHTREVLCEGCEYALEFVIENINHVHASTLRSFLQTSNGHEDYFKALVNGYETELTPEEKLRDIYKDHRGINVVSASYKAGIKDALWILDIKIPGINVEEVL